MRKFLARSLIPVPMLLLAVTAFVACGGDDDSAGGRQGPASSEASTPSTRPNSSTIAEPEVAPAADPVEAAANAVLPPAAPAAQPPVDACAAADVHEAIAGSDAVADGMTFEITYLRCAEGYGWAQILADFGDGATVFFEGSGGDISLLGLGSSVCPTAVGMPASVADELAPAGSPWRQECGA